MKSTKIIVLAIAVLLVVFPVFAKGGKEAVGEKVTMSIMASGTYDAAANVVKGDFLKDTGIDVNVAAFPYAVLRQNNTTDLLTGGGQYDLMSGSYYLADVYEYFLPLDDYIAKYNFGANLLPGLMEKCEFYDGHQIGLPYGIDVYGYMYRKDILDKAGLTWPKTWNQFVDMLPDLDKAAKANGLDTIVFAGGAPEQLIALFFDKYDSYVVSKDNKFKLDEKEAVEVLEMNNVINKYMAKDFLSLSIDDANARFLDGGGLILIGWPSFIVEAADNATKSKIAGKWELGEAFTPGRPWLSLWQLFISKHSKNPDASFQWANYFLSEQFDKKYYLDYGVSPIYQSTYDDPAIMKEHAHQFVAQAANVNRASNPNVSGEAQDYFASLMADFFLGAYTPAELVRQVNSQWASYPVPKALLDITTKLGQKER